MPVGIGFGQCMSLTVASTCLSVSPQGAVSAVIETQFVICCVRTVLFMTTMLGRPQRVVHFRSENSNSKLDSVERKSPTSKY